jgi:hypothetical protein
MDVEAGRESKSFCQADPSWACAYAPKMEETYKALPFRRSSSERRTVGEAPEGTSGLIFFRPFFVQRQRKDIKSRHSERARGAV